MRFSLLLLSFFCLFNRVAAESSLQSSRAAQVLLGPDTWSRIVHVENANPGSVYPKSFYALVFEFAGILWFYSETDGTQSFSLYENRLAEEKADFSREMKAIDPGFRAYSIVGDDAPVSSAHRSIPNGCFIQSLVVTRDQILKDPSVSEIRLVMYYAKNRREGHCVVAYRTTGGVYTLDPGLSNKPRHIGNDWPKGDIALAQAAWPGGKSGRIAAARTLAVPFSSERPETLMAGTPQPVDSANRHHG